MCGRLLIYKNLSRRFRGSEHHRYRDFSLYPITNKRYVSVIPTPALVTGMAAPSLHPHSSETNRGSAIRLDSFNLPGLVVLAMETGVKH